ncbi:MAG: hypothetical protein Q8Q28_07640 [Pseudomonadota bacterium]|nr:hypothetical protein [Pseudomonadota bacterium]
MTRTYPIRGSEQQAAATPPTTDIAITRQRRLLPGGARAAGGGEIEAAGDEVVRVELENGFVLWARADDLIRERGRQTVGRDGGTGWEIDMRPPARSGKAGTRGGLGRLRMDNNANKPDIQPTDLLDDFYGPLLEFLARSHRVEIFPYDWRLSVRDAAVKLADKLEAWLPEVERQGQPVHLVVHSMGGLVELLPFDPDSPDFARQTLWHELKRQLAARWCSASARWANSAPVCWPRACATRCWITPCASRSGRTTVSGHLVRCVRRPSPASWSAPAPAA